MDFSMIIRSMRKSTIRVRGMRRMAVRRRSYPQLLAEDLDISPKDLRRMLYGKLPHYSPALSPLRLGLLKREKRGKRYELVITPLGDAVVAQLSSIIGRR